VLSERFKHIFMLRSVTRVGHARGDLTLGPITSERRQGQFEKNRDWLVLTPATARRDRRAMIDRFEAVKDSVDSLSYNDLKVATGSADIGIIACGLSNGYALEAVKWLDMEAKVSFLKIGTPWPLPERLIRELLASSRNIIVVEELEPFVETHVKAIALDAGLSVRVHGKDVLPG